MGLISRVSSRTYRKMSVSCNDVISCDTHVWYDVLKKYTNQQVHIKIPDKIIEYLKSDGTVVLPEYADMKIKRKLPSEDSWASDDEEENENNSNLPDFSE